jgi:hypothetical protein
VPVGAPAAAEGDRRSRSKAARIPDEAGTVDCGIMPPRPSAHAAVLPLLAALLLFLTACTRSPALGPDGCPKDLLAAQGSACSPESKTCGADPSGFTHLLMCSGGRWTEMEAPPPPPPPPPPPSTGPTASYDTSCQYDDECVPAPGCCPTPCTSNVINQRGVGRATADLATSCPKDPKCFSVGGCRTHAYLCVRKSCALVYEDSADWRPETARTHAR